MHILVTRPEADSHALVRALEERGHSAEVEPLLHIRVRHDQPVDLEGVRTLLVTSANGVRAFAELSPVRNLRVLAVGAASADAARAAGFARVESADGDAEALTRLAIARLDPAEGPLFHPAGTVTAGTMKTTLEHAGFDVRRVPLYEAVPAERLSESARGALAEGRLDAVLFFSPRTAKVFVRLTYDEHLADACRSLEAGCLSQAVAEAVRTLPWRDVRIAERPERDALLAVLDRVPPSPVATNRPRPATARAATKGAMTQDRNAPAAESHSAAGENAALRVIRRFGGIRPMAHKLDLAVSTVQGWKNRGAIPESRHEEVLEAARRHDIELDHSELRASAEHGSTAAAPAEADEHAAGAEAEAASAAEKAREAAAGQHAAGAEAEAAGWHADTPQPGAPDRAGPEAETIGAAVPPPPRRTSGGWLPGMLLGAAILLVGVAAAVGTRGSWLPYVQDRFDLTGSAESAATATPREELDALETRLAELSSRVADLGEGLAEVRESAGGGPPLAELRDRVAGMESALADATSRMNTLASRMENASGRMESAVQRIDSLTARTENLSGRVENLANSAVAGEEVEEISQRLDQVEDQVAALGDLEQRIRTQSDVKATARAAAAGLAAQTLAVAELRDALRFSAPFQGQLEAARKVMATDGPLGQALDELAPMAGDGVPTRAELASAFDRAARDAVAAAQGASEEGLLGGVLRRLNDVVTVRKVGADAEGGGANAVLARAEAKLAAGDLAAAVDTVAALEPPAKAEMESWLAQARSRLAAERALSQLSADLMTRLSQAGDAGGE